MLHLIVRRLVALFGDGPFLSCRQTAKPTRPLNLLSLTFQTVRSQGTDLPLFVSSLEHEFLPGTQWIDWEINSDETAVVLAEPKPPLAAKFPAEPMPFHAVLAHLEAHGAVDVQVANHRKVERVAGQGNARVSYKVERDLDTKWKAKARPEAVADHEDKAWPMNLDVAAVKRSPWLRIVLKVECPCMGR